MDLPGENGMLPVKGMPNASAFRKGKAMVHSKDAAGRFTWSDRLGKHGSTIETKRSDGSWDPKNGHSKPNFYWQQLKRDCRSTGDWFPELEARPSFEMGGKRVNTGDLGGLAATESERSAQIAQIAIAKQSESRPDPPTYFGPPPAAPLVGSNALYERPAAVAGLHIPATSPLKKVPRRMRAAQKQERAAGLAGDWGHMPLALLRGKMHGPVDFRKEGVETHQRRLKADTVCDNGVGGTFRTKYWDDESFRVDGGRPQKDPGKVVFLC